MIEIKAIKNNDKVDVTSNVGMANVGDLLEELSYGVINVLKSIADETKTNLPFMCLKFNDVLIDNVCDMTIPEKVEEILKSLSH